MKSMLLAAIVAATLLPALHGQAQLATQVNMPKAPGERSMKARLDMSALGNGAGVELTPSQVTVSVVYGIDSLEVARAFDMQRRDPSKYFEERVASVGAVSNGRSEVSFVFPHSGKPATTRGRVFPAGTRLFFAIAREHFIGTGTTQPLTLRSAIFSFTMPRKFTVALVGDSYASGEGAKASSGWLHEPCHRSALSGGELAIRKLINERKDLEIDYVNVTCSGAKLTDFYQDAQLVDENDPSKGSKQGRQVDLVQNWLRSRGHGELDLLVADGGGNDLHFADVVISGLTGVFSNIRTNQELLARVDAAFSYMPDNYRLFQYYLNSKINVSRVIWYNYPNPVTGNPLTNGTHDRMLCRKDNDPKPACWTLEHNLSTDEWQFVFNRFLIPLNQRVREAATEFGWDLVDVSNESVGKGLCNCTGYFNTVTQSISRQQDLFGTMHPNPTGFREIYRDRLFRQMQTSIQVVQNEFIADARARAIAAAKERARAEAMYNAASSKIPLIMAEQNRFNLLLKPYKLQLIDYRKFNIDPSRLQRIDLNN